MGCVVGVDVCVGRVGGLGECDVYVVFLFSSVMVVLRFLGVFMVMVGMLWSLCLVSLISVLVGVSLIILVMFVLVKDCMYRF